MFIGNDIYNVFVYKSIHKQRTDNGDSAQCKVPEKTAIMTHLIADASKSF